MEERWRALDDLKFGEVRGLTPPLIVLTWHRLGNVSRGGGRSQRPVQLGPVALVDAGDVAVVRHVEVLILRAVRQFYTRLAVE